MFWGLNLKPNRKYTQVTNKSFHISQAALDVESATSDGANQIFISCENQKFLICTLRKGSCEQVMLDLNFAEGDEICFQSVGSGNVSLSGYLVLDDSMNFMDGEEEEEESEVEMENDLRNALNKKAKAKKAGNEKTKKAAVKAEADDDDDDDEDDSTFNGDALLEADDDEDEEDESSDEDDDEEDDDDSDEDEEDDDESEDEEVPQPKAKQIKLDKQQNGIAKENAVAPEKKNKKDKKAGQQQQQQQKAGGERVLTGGVKVEDLRVGNGPEAKVGKRAQVYYEGRLKSNNKVFDSLKQGNGFKFELGRGEVIKGWDVGVVGMKVGGRRRITCPPHMGYGARGSPPTIPPNSTLVFEVELKAVV